jgi:hypothetical protein
MSTEVKYLSAGEDGERAHKGRLAEMGAKKRRMKGLRGGQLGPPNDDGTPCDRAVQTLTGVRLVRPASAASGAVGEFKAKLAASLADVDGLQLQEGYTHELFATTWFVGWFVVRQGKGRAGFQLAWEPGGGCCWVAWWQAHGGDQPAWALFNSVATAAVADIPTRMRCGATAAFPGSVPEVRLP